VSNIVKVAIVAFTVAIGMTIGVLLWVLIPAIPSPDSYTNTTATISAYVSSNRKKHLNFVAGHSNTDIHGNALNTKHHTTTPF